ncbi:uncharacterized protein PV09_07738, partial [Verruconis gallopava]
MARRVAPAPEMEAMTLPKSMRAWTFTSAGLPKDVLEFQAEAAMPALPTARSVLIRVSHVALHPGSLIMMNLVPRFFRKFPATAETDFSGTVVAAGDDVATAPADLTDERSFPIGSAVFGTIPVATHLKGSGALAEYLVVDVDSIAKKPGRAAMDEAAGLAISAATALDVVDMADITEAQSVLVNAPCGGVGSFVTQLVRSKVGPNGRVVGVCSTSSSALAMNLGCDETVEYDARPDGQSLVEFYKGLRGRHDLFDAIVDCHGSQDLWCSSPLLLKSGPLHHYATVGPKFTSYSLTGVLVTVWQMLRNMVTPVWAGGVDRSYRQAASFVDAEKLKRIADLVDGGIMKTYVGGSWRFEDALEAYEVGLRGHAKGKLLIKVE